MNTTQSNAKAVSDDSHRSTFEHIGLESIAPPPYPPPFMLETDYSDIPKARPNSLEIFKTSMRAKINDTIMVLKSLVRVAYSQIVKYIRGGSREASYLYLAFRASIMMFGSTLSGRTRAIYTRQFDAFTIIGAGACIMAVIFIIYSSYLIAALAIVSAAVQFIAGARIKRVEKSPIF